MADGAPAQLAADIDKSVVEIVSNAPEAIRARLSGISLVQSITQLGQRLRILLPADAPDPVGTVQRAIKSESADTQVAMVPANLEDVFVAVTQKTAVDREAA